MQWISIRETKCAINWIEIYMVDSAIHLLNNCGQVLFHSFSFHCSFALHYSHNHCFKIETECKRSKTELVQTIVKSTTLGRKHVTNKIAQLISFASDLLERALGPLTLYKIILKLMSLEPVEYASVRYYKVLFAFSASLQNEFRSFVEFLLWPLLRVKRLRRS